MRKPLITKIRFGCIVSAGIILWGCKAEPQSPTEPVKVAPVELSVPFMFDREKYENLWSVQMAIDEDCKAENNIVMSTVANTEEREFAVLRYEGCIDTVLYYHMSRIYFLNVSIDQRYKEKRLRLFREALARFEDEFGPLTKPDFDLGLNWSVITVVNGEDVASRWKATGLADAKNSMIFRAGENEGRKSYIVQLVAPERVVISYADKAGDRTCHYEGRIRQELDLDGYEAFYEDADSAKRPAFYRIITGTYACDNKDETEGWAAKIND